MPNSSYLIANRTGKPVSDRSGVDERDVLSTGTGVIPIAWLAMFEPADIELLQDSDQFTLITERERALERVRRRREIFATVFEIQVVQHVEVLMRALSTDASHVQALIHELPIDPKFADDHRAWLVRLLEAVVSRDRKSWQALLASVQSTLAPGWDPGKRGETPAGRLPARDAGVNALVGWLSGERAPELGSLLGPETLPGAPKVVPYTASVRYETGALVEHPKFGIGRVTLARLDKIDVDFKEGAKTLLHARES